MPDRTAHFLALLDAHRALLCKVCRVYARTEADREDLHQEILAQLWRALPRFRGEASETTWLYRVALNTAISYYRRSRTRRQYVPDDEATPETWQATCPGPDEALAERERLDRLYGAIGRLSDAEKALVVLYLEDRSYREMADVLGLSESNVGVRLHRIKKKLATLLREVPA